MTKLAAIVFICNLLISQVSISDEHAESMNFVFSDPEKSTSSTELPRCSIEDIQRVERELKVELPADYKKFLLDRNAIFFKDVFFQSGGRRLEVYRLYGVNPTHAPAFEDLRAQQVAYEFRERVPAGVLKIGHSVSHYHGICISTRKVDFGRVFLWDPQLPWEDGPNVQTMQYLKPLANSFEDFWKALVKGDG